MRIGVSLPVREMKDDIKAIKEFALLAEDLGYAHLRVPDQVLRPGNAHSHEPLTLLSFIAAITDKIELVPSVIILPLRKTVLLARQAAGLDILSGGRLRLGVGVGSNEEEYRFLGVDYRTRGFLCDEQMTLLKDLWQNEVVTFEGRWHGIEEVGLNPLPIQRPIPMWIGAQVSPSAPVLKRIATQSNGWFVLATPEKFDAIKAEIDQLANELGRDSKEIGTEAGVAVVGPRESEWQCRVERWEKKGLSHLCLRTLGGGLSSNQHLRKLEEVTKILRNL